MAASHSGSLHQHQLWRRSNTPGSSSWMKRWSLTRPWRSSCLMKKFVSDEPRLHLAALFTSVCFSCWRWMFLSGSSLLSDSLPLHYCDLHDFNPPPVRAVILSNCSFLYKVQSEPQSQIPSSFSSSALQFDVLMMIPPPSHTEYRRGAQHARYQPNFQVASCWDEFSRC